MQPHEMPEDFCFASSTRDWLAKEYPQLDIDKTEQAIIEWGTNAIETNKRHPEYGQPLKCKNWQMKARNVIRIQVINKWSSIAIPKQGQEVDMRWREALTHAKAIGCPEQRRPTDSVDSFKARVKMWESRPSKSAQMFDFGALKKMV